MKRILLLLFSLITTAAIGQYPINQILSSDSTMVSVGRNATGGIRGGLVNMVFADTTAANLSRISYYTGAQIWTTTDSAIWVRFKGTPSFWVKMAGASGGTTGSFWNITGNYFGGGVPLNYGVGTNSYDYLPLKTNNITRLLIPPDGILRSSAPANKYLMMDTTTLEMYYGDGGGGSGWSLTGNAGTTSSNFIGTTDDQPLVLKTNNLKRIKITADTIFVDSVNTVFENKVPYWSYPNKTYNINRLIYNSNGDRFETKINGQGTSYKHYGNSFVDSSSSPPLSAFVDTWWQNTNGVDTLLWLRGLHHSYNDTHFFLADMTNTIAPNGGIPPNRFMTVEHYGTDFFAWYNIPTYNKPITVAGGLYPASLALGGDLGLSRYGFGVSTRKFFSLDTAYFKKHVGIGTESPDSLLTVKDGGLYANKGVRFSGLPSGIPSGAKRLLISGDGTLYAADTTAGGGSGSGWSLTGNAGTNAATNFIGTTDGQPLMFRYNNLNAGSIGKSSGGTYLGIGAGENDNAEDEPNVGVGYYALYYNTTGSANSAVGASALASNTTGSGNSAVGVVALYNNTTGNGNSAVGANALSSNTTGYNNSAVGTSAGDNAKQKTNAIYQNLFGAYTYGTRDSITVLGADFIKETIVRGKLIDSTLSAGAGTKAVRWNSSTGEFTYADTSEVTTPTWQQTLTAGSTLTQDNTITSTGYDFSFNGQNIQFNATDGVDLTGTIAGTTSTISVDGSQLTLRNSRSGATSGLDIRADSIMIEPHLGLLKIDTLAAASSQNQLIGWTSTSGANRGKVGAVTIGTGLSLSSGTLNSVWTASGNDVYNNNSGNVGIGTSTPATKFHTVGTVRHQTLGTAITDTTTYKPLVINSSGDVLPSTYWYGGGGGLTIGTTTIASSATGSILYDSSGTLSRNADLYWDVSNKRLGIATRTPSAPIHVYKWGSSSPLIALTGMSGTLNIYADASTQFHWSENLVVDKELTLGGGLSTAYGKTYDWNSGSFINIQSIDFNGASSRIKLAPDYNGGSTVANQGVIVKYTNPSSGNYPQAAFQAYSSSDDTDKSFLISSRGFGYLKNSKTDETVFYLKAAASQTANLLELKNSSSTILSSFDKDGKLYLGSSSAPTTTLQVNGTMAVNQGTDVASANNLAVVANSTEITGTTQVNLIANTGWVNGSQITLLLASGITIKNGQTTSGSNITILLDGAADFVTSAASSLTLLLCEVGGTQAWREISRRSY